MKRIVLYDLGQLGLVIEYRSAVIYQNQAGGYSCAQMEQEGVFAPIDLPEESVALIENGPYPNGGLTLETADMIDSQLARWPGTAFVKVDRDRIEDSLEAWVYVLIDTPEQDPGILYGESDKFPPAAWALISGFGKTRAVLTWANSD